jgi:hypothetical protein
LRRRRAWIIACRSGGAHAGLDQRQAPGRQQRRPDTLQQPRGDQEPDHRRARAEAGGGGEERDAGEEHTDPAEAVPGRSAEQDQRGERQQIGVEDPLELAHPGAEVAADDRQRDVDHGPVEERHRGSGDRDAEQPMTVGTRDVEAVGAAVEPLHRA